MNARFRKSALPLILLASTFCCGLRHAGQTAAGHLARSAGAGPAVARAARSPMEVVAVPEPSGDCRRS